MAGFRTHITVSTALGVGYGAFSARPLGFEPEAAFLATGLTAVGGMLPDLDSDSGRPVKELFALAGAVVPMLLMPRFLNAGMSHEGVLAALVLAYVVVRYGGSWVIKRASVHRGMYHSIPAMLIAGLIVFLEYGGDPKVRVLLSVGVMLGFLSHLVLDEIYSVDINGLSLKLKSSAGSAVKLVSPSWFGTSVCYGLLAALGLMAWADVSTAPPGQWAWATEWLEGGR